MTRYELSPAADDIERQREEYEREQIASAQSEQIESAPVVDAAGTYQHN